MPSAASVPPNSAAACAYAGSLPGLEPQNTQTLPSEVATPRSLHRTRSFTDVGSSSREHDAGMTSTRSAAPAQTNAAPPSSRHFALGGFAFVGLLLATFGLQGGTQP